MLGDWTILAARAQEQTKQISCGSGREFRANYMENIEFSRRIFLVVLCSYVVGVIQEHFNVTVCRCPISGVTSEEVWRDHNGMLHRWDEPAIVRRNRDSGIVTERSFFWQDQLHRLNGEPARLLYEERSGQLIRRDWLVHGEYSRPGDLPHVEWLDEQSGMVVRAEYRMKTNAGKRSVLHRENGPALLLFDGITGQQIESAFYRFGRKPAGPSAPAPQL